METYKKYLSFFLLFSFDPVYKKEKKTYFVH